MLSLPYLNIMRIRSYNLILLYGGGFPSKRTFIQYLHNIIYCVFVLVTWSCLTLCDSTNPSVYRQEDWSGLPFPSPENLPNTGIKPGSPALLVDSLPSEPPGKAIYNYLLYRLTKIIFRVKLRSICIGLLCTYIAEIFTM